MTNDKSLVDVLHSEFGVDLDDAYVIAQALGRDDTDNFSSDNRDMLVGAAINLSRQMLEQANEHRKQLV